MKKTLAILLVAVLSIGLATEANAKFRVGPRIGLNVNKLHINSSAFDSENRAGFTGGVQVEYMFPIINVGLDLSVLYTYMDPKVDQKYFDLTPTKAVLNTNVSAFDDPAKNFLEIPLNVKYRIGIPAISSIIAPYIFTGPSVAFKLDGDDRFKAAQWTWNVGIGLELIRHLQIGASYGFGINNVVKDLEVPILGNMETVKARNNYWTVTAAWLF